jgi:hypothetical protein
MLFFGALLTVLSFLFILLATLLEYTFGTFPDTLHPETSLFGTGVVFNIRKSAHPTLLLKLRQM